MVHFLFPYRIWTQLKKSLWLSYFILKAFSFLYQFYQIPYKYIRQPNCFKNSVLNQEKKALINTTVKFSIKNLDNYLQNILKLIVKNKSWYNHDFLESVIKNASSYSPFNAAVIGYFDVLTLCLITAVVFHKNNIFSIRISTLHSLDLFNSFNSLHSISTFS